VCKCVYVLKCAYVCEWCLCVHMCVNVCVYVFKCAHVCVCV